MEEMQKTIEFENIAAEDSSRYTIENRGLPLGALVLRRLAALMSKVPVLVRTAWVCETSLLDAWSYKEVAVMLCYWVNMM